MSAKFNKNLAPEGKTGALRTTGVAGTTHEGGIGYATDNKTSLFRLAVTNMASEKTFYEQAKDRDSRFVSLIRAVVAEDPEWLARFVPYLRNEMFMRSAPIVVAAEYAAAGGPNPRGVINSAMSRADEPAEFLGYWQANHGGRQEANYPRPAPRLSGGVQRGLADAATRLYNEFSALKYDGTSNAIRMGDVLELAHPKPKDSRQAALFKYLLDRRHRGGDANLELGELDVIARARELDAMDRDTFRQALLGDPELLNSSGFTWERLSGKTEMDAAAWEAIIPNMGPMALIRNLRNFDEANISKEAVATVKAVITDDEKIANSKLFPFRFWSAYKNAPSLRWGEALEEALSVAVRHIPVLSGRTLVLVDYSGSMSHSISDRSTVSLWEVGALFGVAQYLRTEKADLVAFGNNAYQVPINQAADMLKGMDIANAVYQANGHGGYRYNQHTGQRSVQASSYPGAESIGHGTETFKSIAETYDGHDRIVIFSDMQAFSDPWGRQDKSFVDNLNIPIYSFDLAGYAKAHLPAGEANRYMLAGFSDASFTMMKVLEDGSHAGWSF